VSRGRPVSHHGARPTLPTLAWLRQLDTDAGLASYPLELPSPGPDQPGVTAGPEYLDLDDQQAWRDAGGRVCRRCGWGVPLMTSDDQLCPCGGQLL
jgi:hypothetical protein